MTKPVCAENEIPHILIAYRSHLTELYNQFKIQFTLGLYGLQGAMDAFNKDESQLKSLSPEWQQTLLGAILYGMADDIQEDIVARMAERLNLSRAVVEQAKADANKAALKEDKHSLEDVIADLERMKAQNDKVKEEIKTEQADLVGQLFDRLAAKQSESKH